MSATDDARLVYNNVLIDLAIAQGWTEAHAQLHIESLNNANEDEMSITHPFNWLTEEQVEGFFND